MPRLSKEFVKVETRILHDYRFWQISEFEQLLYLMLLVIARATQNKIPKEISIIKGYFRSNRSDTEVQSALNRLKEIFPKFKETKYFYRFDGYKERLVNYVPKKSRNKGVDEDEDEDIDIDKDEDITKKKFLDYVFLTGKEYEKLKERLGAAATEEYIKRLNNYIGSKGKKYKSHYHTILVWADKDPKPKVKDGFTEFIDRR